MAEPQTVDYLDQIALEDVEGLKKAQESYGDSWKKRGGVGAWMMLARKIDRLEARMEQAPQIVENRIDGVESFTWGDRYDVFKHCEADDRSEGVIDDIRDLRRYLLLVEAELRRRGVMHGAHRDNEVQTPMPDGP